MSQAGVFIGRADDEVLGPPHQLNEALNWQANGGPITAFLGASSALPATAFLRFPPNASSAEQLVQITGAGGVLVALIKLMGAIEFDSTADIELALRIDSMGCFFAEAAQAGRQMRALCETHTLIVYSRSDTEAVTATTPACAGPLSTLANGTANVFIGIVQQGAFRALIQPDAHVPAFADVFLDVGDEHNRRLFFDLMAVEPSELYDDEIESLNEGGEFDLIDDDKAHLLEFTLSEDRVSLEEIRAFQVRVSLDASHRLSVAAFDVETKRELVALFQGNAEALDLSGMAASENGWGADASEALEHEGESGVDDAMLPLRAVRLLVESDFPNFQFDEQRRRLTPSRSIQSTPATQRVFISHRTDMDGKLASQVVAWLEGQGVACWVAPRDIRAGANWNRSIMAAVAHCTDMVVIISRASFESDFLQAEVHRAFKLGKRVIPIVLEPGLPCTDIDVRLETRQHVEWWGGADEALAQLHRTLA